MTNLATIVGASAQRNPAGVAIKMDDIELTFTALEVLSSKVAGLLAARGVKPGDRVALIAPNIPQMPPIYFGILRYGAIVVPLNPLLKSREVAYHLKDSGATLAFAWDGVMAEVVPGAQESGTEVIAVDADFMALLAGAEPIPEVALAQKDDTAVILYTSGTTGRPKGAELTHENLRSNAEVSVSLFNSQPGDVIFGGLPFFHIFGQTCALNSAVMAGATVTILPRFDPLKALEIIQRDKVTIFEGVPTMYIALLRAPGRENYDLSTLRLAASGGSPLPLEVLHEFETVFGATMLEGYGLSETSPVVTFNQLDGIRKPGSIGQPVAGAQLRVLDDAGNDVEPGAVGEIAVAGPYVMKGYWNNPEATAQAIPDGWFRTGDLGRMDEDGVYFIVDRKKDMILRGGYNIYPREIEEVLYEHPAVAEAAVVGMPDDVHGEEVCAAVSLKPGAVGAEDPEALAAEIVEFVKARVAAYKFPRRVIIMDTLPKGPTGKILKREISVS
ncbi:long-chain-fatty-acid--CoA ligase [Arthrobacter psychrochitiniphilus]|uniref:Long-chain-fatty-acid--CoA ligase n=1 Tax=Arthrobacter psychrochitiniphilus TaxID=291045 RepID=A0A2V3DV72_9MICC|nr:long-chain fatty acid--CoA ligase [Arthrobacter psychrochitiniphilus]NYG16890.1 long-chain acyl-CoA synthetase [Arthrobacter psychrochitiniphilus]PXA69033.1 long-chain-fatty-acid--CoA ligase [Arthrobacter psychrochitiniphilus]